LTLKIGTEEMENEGGFLKSMATFNNETHEVL
jgi:hypothetical protein